MPARRRNRSLAATCRPKTRPRSRSRSGFISMATTSRADSSLRNICPSCSCSALASRMPTAKISGNVLAQALRRLCSGHHCLLRVAARDRQPGARPCLFPGHLYRRLGDVPLCVDDEHCVSGLYHRRTVPAGETPENLPAGGLHSGVQAWKFVMLPAIVSIVGGLGATVRLYRTFFLDEINQDYVRTARAKGVSEWAILFRHVLKNAAIPILTPPLPPSLASFSAVCSANPSSTFLASGAISEMPLTARILRWYGPWYFGRDHYHSRVSVD